MKRLGELNSKVIVEQQTAPHNKHVIWKDPVEDKFKEFKDAGWAESDQIAPAGQNVYELILKDNVFSYTLPDTDDAIDEKIGQIDLPFGIDTILISNTSPTGYVFKELEKDSDGAYILATKSNGSGRAIILLNENGEIFVFRWENKYGAQNRITGLIETNSDGYMTILKDVWDGICEI